MSFKWKLRIFSVVLCACSVGVHAAEWKSEPSLFLKGQYNDNVRLRADNANPEGSTGFTLEPRIKFAGEELNLWDIAVDARAKVTRYQDIEDGDSENIFFVFDGGKQTERSEWRLNASLDRNINLDTDFDTSNPDNGAFNDRTVRKTASISPSVAIDASEILRLTLFLNNTDVSFEEVTSLSYQDYTYSSLSFIADWTVAQNHQLGFTSSYSEYESPGSSFSFDKSILQLDYTYIINPNASAALSFGGRSLESLRTVPVVGDLKNKDNGTVVKLSYSSRTETASHRFTASRDVSPSSFGGAQEIRSATYLYRIENTERFTTKLILDASESSTINGTLVSRFNDRIRYRVEPSLTYKLNRNWNLQFLYRYIGQDFTGNDRDSAANAIFINLFLHWPKLATTY